MSEPLRFAETCEKCIQKAQNPSSPKSSAIARITKTFEIINKINVFTNLVLVKIFIL